MKMKRLLAWTILLALVACQLPAQHVHAQEETVANEGMIELPMIPWGDEQHNHNWAEATCTTPKTCSSCGLTKGEALGHTGETGTCDRCGEVFGIPGDLDGNDTVNDSDALYLLRHTLFPGRYPVEQDADVNSDGAVTDADALYLLRHTLFPSRYPLYPA